MVFPLGGRDMKKDYRQWPSRKVVSTIIIGVDLSLRCRSFLMTIFCILKGGLEPGRVPAFNKGLGPRKKVGYCPRLCC